MKSLLFIFAVFVILLMCSSCAAKGRSDRYWVKPASLDRTSYLYDEYIRACGIYVVVDDTWEEFSVAAGWMASGDRVSGWKEVEKSVARIDPKPGSTAAIVFPPYGPGYESKDSYLEFMCKMQKMLTKKNVGSIRFFAPLKGRLHELHIVAKDG